KPRSPCQAGCAWYNDRGLQGFGLNVAYNLPNYKQQQAGEQGSDRRQIYHLATLNPAVGRLGKHAPQKLVHTSVGIPVRPSAKTARKDFDIRRGSGTMQEAAPWSSLHVILVCAKQDPMHQWTSSAAPSADFMPCHRASARRRKAA